MQVLIGKTGQFSLKRRVSEFDVELLKVHHGLRVKKMLNKLSISDIQSVSAGAATFYVWVSEEVNPQK